CGGGCPSCQSGAGNLKVSQPNDAAEIEADAIADRVMRMPARAEATNPTNHIDSTTGIHRKCNACKEEEETIQRKPLPAANGPSSQNPDHVNNVISSGGQPLDLTTQQFFEPRLGRDLSSVRVHTGSAASQSARAVDARAYTLGHNIVFGSGEYAPHSESGRHLLAHELAHVSQAHGSNKLHRRLKVDAPASEDPATAISMMDPLITALCPDFEIDSTSGVVRPKAGTPCSIPRFRAVRASSNPLGCCCLCTMTRPWGADWRIVVTSRNAPKTDGGTHTVRMTPTSGPNAPELRHWTGGPVETMVTQPPAESFGHELCGHAALMRIRAHPDHFGNTDRSYSDIHDPTVNIENALATEMGLPSARRGLADSGTHRGESLRVFTVGPFAANADDPTPFAAQITAATDFLNGTPELLFDTVGFQDAADTTAGVSLTRATRVRGAIIAGLGTMVASVETSPGVPETLTRPQPATDGGVSASRIVEIRMAIRPAGLITPIGVPPPALSAHVDEEISGRVASLKRGSVNECHELLAATAWP
ncbi:MAG TPA: DUF4157 domain-containing protein, partial [Pyrinomonadaceae bacterium]|nr:DUF4157 domain-containing protein [Pyrinomonadaceae bacterium]